MKAISKFFKRRCFRMHWGPACHSIFSRTLQLLFLCLQINLLNRNKDSEAMLRSTAVCEKVPLLVVVGLVTLEEMEDSVALANEFGLPFSNLKPTKREMLLRTRNCGLSLYAGAPDLPPTPRSPPQGGSNDSPILMGRKETSGCADTGQSIRHQALCALQ